jgi:hypothetical protein
MMDDEDKFRIKQDPLAFLKDHEAIARIAQLGKTSHSAVRGKDSRSSSSSGSSSSSYMEQQHRQECLQWQPRQEDRLQRDGYFACDDLLLQYSKGDNT